MRKLLLGTSALVAATFSANALADVSISGYYEWRYESRSSQVTTSDGTTFGSDSEVKIQFSNKTDAGLDVGLKMELETDAGNSIVQESAITISGGFGKVQLGSDDGINDGSIPVSMNDLIGEEIFSTSGAGGTATGLKITSGDMANLGGNSNKIAYYLPSMGGLSVGVAHTNASAAGDSDTTDYGASYSMDAGGASITIAGASGTTENSTQDIDSQVIGVKVVQGNISAIVSQAEYEASGKDQQSTGATVAFKVSDAMKIAVFTAETEDDLTSEEYTNTGAELNYTIASGLNAIINVEDYDYKVGTSSNTADNGTHSKLTIKATF
jgi:hypothetical protein